MAKGTIVVSLRSKGVPSFTASTLLDVRYQAIQFATEFWDIFLACAVSLSCLSWSAWISVGVCIASVAGTVTTNFSIATMDMVFVFFMFIVLPLLVLLTFVFRRRDAALQSLAQFKASFVSLVLHRPAGSSMRQREASTELYQRAATFMNDLRLYLQHRRPYARHFYLPFRASTPTPNDPVLKVSRELGILQRRVHRGVRDLHLACSHLRETGVSDAEVANMISRVEAMHAAVEQLSCIKEARTPVVLRATTRWFVMVLIPIGMGAFWNHVAHDYTTRAFAGILGVLLHVAFVSIMDTVVAMEDPFDDTALDAISLYEIVDQVAVMTTPPGDADGYDASDGVGDADGPGTGDVPEDEVPPVAHVTMVVSGADGADPDPASVTPAAGPAVVTVGSDVPAAAAAAGTAPQQSTPFAERASVTASNMVSGRMAPVAEQELQPIPTSGGGATSMAPPAGIPAMRASIATSETAVGPPSAIDPYGMGGGGGAAVAGTTALPSITSAPRNDLAGVMRVGAAPPPMPALAGHSTMYHTAATLGRVGVGMY